MDNLTHTLVGLTAAKAGLERLSPGATAVCLLAANAPDADILAAFGGSWFYLKHHRGITHSIVGTLAIALIIPLLFYAGDRIVARLRGRRPGVRLRGLVVASLVVSASHPLMDWTNNYGVRPLLPWDGRWFYGDLVYIVDPWLWLSLGGASFLLTAKTRWRAVAWGALALVATLAFVVLPVRAGMGYPFASRALWLACLVALVVAHQLNFAVNFAARWGRSIALVALAFVVVYWGALGLLHGRALARAQEVAEAEAARQKETMRRVAAMPSLADPTRWRVLAETDRAVYRFETSLLSRVEAERDTPDTLTRFEKPQGEAAAVASRAAADERARIFLDFARFPAVRVEGQNCAEELLVQFADLRFTEPGRAGRGGNFSLEVAVPPAR
ncbi:MAG: inner membrane protein [Pyrinomonadaceae bacterium]|jgi:inner membrane protein|nr:inner membrane protein [Pyrinomonadaceae bacterium]